ncbi:acyl-CoA synthetases/AMP-acid ligases II [Xylaria sp. FL0933]|nr:acyl-CoA synthetases/AMP-acid ligases II [Xylaria sp. FL0933]
MSSFHCRQLPDEPIFQRLIDNTKTHGRVIFHDPTCGVDATYPQLLHDIVSLRQRLHNWLPSSIFDKTGLLSDQTSPYILVLAPGNYDFVVASFTVLAIGGALVPLAPAILPEEALYFAQKCKSLLLLASSSCWELAAEIQAHAGTEGYNIDVQLITPKSSYAVIPLSEVSDIIIGPDMKIAPSRPSIVLFTSGTTGPPKGVVNSRLFFYYGYGTSSDDVFLTHRPVHWIGGLRSIINLVLSGTRQEVIEPNEKCIWERLRIGGVTMLCCVIPMWCKLMKYYEEVLSKLPDAQRNDYIEGIRGLRIARVGGAVPMPSLLMFWRETIGIPLEVTYGCTETGGPGMITDNNTNRTLERCLGKPEPGVTIKYSDGDEGEILVKTQFLFTHYLDDETATAAAFTPDGFYKTGDIARRVEDEYIIEGRASTDFVRFHGFKVPTMEVEEKLAELPFIEEACIVSVSDKDASTRVAALVRLDAGHADVDLRMIREMLALQLLYYKLPTALRILKDGEEIPLAASGKVLRKRVSDEFFPVTNHYELPPEVEIWDITDKQLNAGNRKAWDWAGLQGC